MRMAARRSLITASRSALAATVLLAAAIAGDPTGVLAEGRHDILLDCRFGALDLTVAQNGDGYDLMLSGAVLPATLGQSAGPAPLASVFARAADGPAMLAIATASGGREHPADLTRSVAGADGPTTSTLRGTCMEMTP